MTPPKPGSPSIHPGEVLQAEFLTPHRLSRARLADATGLSYGHPKRLTRGRGRLTGETAFLLGRVFGTTPELRVALQAHYDLARAQIAPAQVARAKAFGTALRRKRRKD